MARQVQQLAWSVCAISAALYVAARLVAAVFPELVIISVVFGIALIVVALLRHRRSRW